MTQLRSALVYACALLVPACAAPTLVRRDVPSPASTPVLAPVRAAASQPHSAPAAPPLIRTFLRVEMPLFSEAFSSTPIATVGDEVVLLGELVDALVAGGQHGTGPAGDPARRYQEVLDRLIDTRLMLLEGRAIGFDALPEVKATIVEARERILRETVERRATKDLKPDAAEIERIFRGMVKEWKVKTVFLATEAAVQELEALVKSGQSFDAAARKLVGEKKAHGGSDGQYLAPGTLLPQIVAVIEKLAIGKVSAPIRVKDGWTVVKLEDVRYPENAGARAQARELVVDKARKQALEEYHQALVKRLVKQDLKLLTRLDLGARRPGYDALLKDQRALARLEGEAPITVADLAWAVAQKFFHGVRPAIRDKKINQYIEPAMKGLLYRRVALRNAQELELEHRPEVQRRIKEQAIAAVVGVFIDRVVVKDVDVAEKEAKAYYAQHLAEYTYPEFVKLTTLGFVSLKAAQEALTALKRGTEFKWLQVHGEQLAPADERTLGPDGKTLAMTALEGALAKTLAGARAGDYRLYASPRGYFYVVQVKEHVPRREQPYAQARPNVVKAVFKAKLSQTVKTWVRKLRQAYRVQIHAQRIGAKGTP